MPKLRKPRGEPAVRAEMPPGTWCVRAKGKVYCYHQPGRGSKNPGERVRIPYTPDDARFWSWHEERGVWGAPATGSLEAAIEAWLVSPTFKSYAEATQKDYTRYAEAMIERWGGRPLGAITRGDMLDWRRTMADRPSTANHAVQGVAASFWKWALAFNLVQVSPLRDITPLAHKAEQANPWPNWAFELTNTHAPQDIRSFVALGRYTGQRTADIVRMSLHHIKDGAIGVAIHKKRDRSMVWIPVHPGLEPVIAETKRRGHIYLVARNNGEPHTPNSFRSLFFRSIRERISKLKPLHDAELSPHGLRVLAVNHLLEIGCSIGEVSAITDQSLATVERYARQRNKRKLAQSAMRRWVDHDRSGGTETER